MLPPSTPPNTVIEPLDASVDDSDALSAGETLDRSTCAALLPTFELLLLPTTTSPDAPTTVEPDCMDTAPGVQATSENELDTDTAPLLDIDTDPPVDKPLAPSETDASSLSRQT